jgi:FMN-dependent NADH-azoreductase
MGTPEIELTGKQRAQLGLSDALIAEIETTDTIVLAVPLHNFSIPLTLKAWIDHVARRGRTFSHAAARPQGLLKGKKVFVLTSRGGVYSEGPTQAFDFQAPYLRAVLGLIGLTDVTFVHFEGIGISPETAKKGFDRAPLAIDEIVGGPRAVA